MKEPTNKPVMNNYKNLEIYKSAFDLAIKVYSINVALPRQELQKTGNPLRRISIRIKDLIAEAFNSFKNEEEVAQHLNLATISCSEAVSLLKKLSGYRNKGHIAELIKKYISLSHKISGHIQNLQTEENALKLQFPAIQITESVVSE
ncbi:MAG: four helix bundle protein [Bacteroidales bacterium]|nr:four helix bundle protein [Bacteroidales bacterium]